MQVFSFLCRSERQVGFGQQHLFLRCLCSLFYALSVTVMADTKLTLKCTVHMSVCYKHLPDFYKFYRGSYSTYCHGRLEREQTIVTCTTDRLLPLRSLGPKVKCHSELSFKLNVFCIPIYFFEFELNLYEDLEL